jgi:hypothetical protein
MKKEAASRGANAFEDKFTTKMDCEVNIGRGERDLTAYCEI